MAYNATGYGAGGAGGGEYANGAFTSPSSGTKGWAAYIIINKTYASNNKHLLINYNGTVYPTYHCQYPRQNPARNINLSPQGRNISLTIEGMTGRSYELNGLKLSNSLVLGDNIEIGSAGVSGNYKSVTSKVIPSIGGSNLQLVINTSQTNTSLNGVNSSATYPGQIFVDYKEGGDSGGSTTLSGTIYSGMIGIFILQAGGGGGGGADNSWGLFNYASGGGGGGGGGACVAYFSESSTNRTFTITIGGAGSAGASHKDESSRTSGTGGGSTRLSIWNSTASSSGEYAYAGVTGGGGGGKSTGNSNHGSGGAKGYCYYSGVNILSIIDGGSGGTNGDGGACSISGQGSLDINCTFLPAHFSVDINTTGTPGNTGSVDDRGGGGGASWLGNGGYY